jgi:hypothetical protein
MSISEGQKCPFGDIHCFILCLQVLEHLVKGIQIDEFRWPSSFPKPLHNFGHLMQGFFHLPVKELKETESVSFFPSFSEFQYHWSFGSCDLKLLRILGGFPNVQEMS